MSNQSTVSQLLEEKNKNKQKKPTQTTHLLLKKDLRISVSSYFYHPTWIASEKVPTLLFHSFAYSTLEGVIFSNFCLYRFAISSWKAGAILVVTNVVAAFLEYCSK